MRRILFAIAVAVSLTMQATAAELAPAEKQGIQSSIKTQLDAFNEGRDADAYAQAAPQIQQMFGSLENFMLMVERGYKPVRRHNSYRFADAFEDNFGRKAQRVLIEGADGKQYEAVYTLTLQPDGTWKITSCTLLDVKGVDA
jgi:hypothetical protein